MTHYTTYWKDEQVHANLGQLIKYAASEQFHKVKRGDIVWVFNIQAGTGAFRLIGRIQADVVTDEAGAKRRFPGKSLYDASHFVCAKKEHEERAVLIPLDRYASQIRFEGSKSTLALRDGKVYAQQVRSLRTLSAESAKLFEDIWRDYHGPSKVPTATEYVRAFEHLGSRVKPQHRQLLAAQYGAFGRETSTRFLADSVCDGNIGTANLFYGGIAKHLCQQLDVEPSYRRDGSPRWWSILARGWEGPGGFVWKMRPEVAEAIEMLGWVEARATASPAEHLDGEEEISAQQYVEGAVRQLLVNAYERDKRARKACLAHYPSICQVCDFDFEARYGELGRGYIHVHHRIPVSQIASEYKVDPIKDLVPVCPNCHAMLHCGRNPPSVEDLREIVRERL